MPDAVPASNNPFIQRNEAPLLGDQQQNRPLHLACFNNDKDEVKRLLVFVGVDPNQLNSENDAPLHVAAAHKHIDCIRQLLDNRADVNLANAEGATALHFVCAEGNKECARLLLTRNADINAVDNEKLTPLHVASKKGHTECVRLLLACRAKVDTAEVHNLTALHFACKNGHQEVVQRLLIHKANPNAVANKKITPLHVACDNGHLECARMLLSRGARVDMTDDKEATALQRACYEGHHLVAKLLLKHGASINVKAEHKSMAIHFACDKGNVECILLLLGNGANIHALAQNNLTPLHIACDKGHLEAARLLLDSGANLNAISDKGATPLHYASKNGHVRVVNFLLERGADSDAKNSNGETAWDLAVKNGHSGNLPRLKELQTSAECFFNCLKNFNSEKPALLRSPSDPSLQFSDNNKVQQLILAWENVQRNLSKVLLIMDELLKTECKYIANLRSTINFYLIPFENPNNLSRIPAGLRGQSMTIFGNIRELYDFHNKHLLPDLMRARNAPGQFCQTFIKYQEILFGLYVQYCNRILPQSQTICRKNNADSCKFILECQEEAEHKLPLSSYLMAPFQRIQRYPLLLKELSKECNKDPSISSLVQHTVDEALSLMKDLVSRINGSTEQENNELRDNLFEVLAKNLQLMEYDTWFANKLFLSGKEHLKKQEEQNSDCPSTSSSLDSFGVNHRCSVCRSQQTVNNNCSICLSQQKNKTAVYRCGHTFCFKCIQAHYSIHDFCPKCRGKIENLVTLHE